MALGSNEVDKSPKFLPFRRHLHGFNMCCCDKPGFGGGMASCPPEKKPSGEEAAPDMCGTVVL